MTFATQMGRLPYSWRIADGAAVNYLEARVEVEIADADGVVHPVPGPDGAPVATFSVEISFDPDVDSLKLVDAAYATMRNKLWLIEAGSTAAVLGQVIAQGYRRPL